MPLSHQVEEIAHSSIGASSASRWMACPASVALCATIKGEDTSSFYAAEGTVAHEMGELCLKQGLNAIDFADTTFRTECEGKDTEFEPDEEMVEAVQLYVDTVREIHAGLEDSELLIEQGFNLDHIHKGLFGTNDACVIQMYGKLVVIDYKHGKGLAVDVKDNKQLKYYGSGAGFELDYIFTEVELVIVQPRAFHKDGPVRRYTLSTDELLTWNEELGEAARETENPDAKFARGEHCRWCKARGECTFSKKEIEEEIMEAFAENSEVVALADPSEIQAKDMAGALDLAYKIEEGAKWAKAVKSHALALAERGMEFEGFVLSTGRKGNKTFNDPKAAVKKFEKEFGDEIYAPQKLKTVTQLIKVVGEDNLKGMFYQNDGALKLVPEGSDSPKVDAPLSISAMFPDDL